jgi:hypothetical protein
VLEIQRRVAGLGSRDLWQLDFQTGQTRIIPHLDLHLPTGCPVYGRPERGPEPTTGTLQAGWPRPSAVEPVAA